MYMLSTYVDRHLSAVWTSWFLKEMEPYNFFIYKLLHIIIIIIRSE